MLVHYKDTLSTSSDFQAAKCVVTWPQLAHPKPDWDSHRKDVTLFEHFRHDKLELYAVISDEMAVPHFHAFVERTHDLYHGSTLKTSLQKVSFY